MRRPDSVILAAPVVIECDFVKMLDVGLVHHENRAGALTMFTRDSPGNRSRRARR